MEAFLHLNGVTYGLPGIETAESAAALLEHLMPKAPAVLSGPVGLVPQRVAVELDGQVFDLHVRPVDVKTASTWVEEPKTPFGGEPLTPTGW